MHGPLALEVLHTGFEEWLVGITGDVLCDILTAAFGMTHLTEDASVRTGDAFDSPGGAVRIVAAVVGRLAIWPHVLCRDLAIGCECPDLFIRSDEASFAVADGDGVEVTGLAEGKPRRLGRYDLGRDEAGDMTAERVEGERRCVIGERLEFAIRYESELDQSLETVADAHGKTVSDVKELVHGLHELLISEYSGDKFTAAVRFIARREATREHDDLRMADAFCHFIDGVLEFGCIAISEDEDIADRTGTFKGSRAVDFTVVARHGRDEDARTRKIRMDIELRDRFRFRQDRRFFPDVCCAAREYRIERTFIGAQELFDGDLFPAELHAVTADGAEDLRVRLFGKCLCQFWRSFYKDRAIEIAEVFEERQIFTKGDAELVAEGHRMYDVIRNGMTVKRIDVKDSNLTSTKHDTKYMEYDWNFYMIVLPIPKKEMDTNPNMEQNPEYGGI